MNKIFIFIFILVVFTYTSYAQIDVFESEIVVKNNIAYYNNKPFTGTLYSDDDTVIPNECECTKKAAYKNGLLDGMCQEWTKNGEILKEAYYSNGIIQNEKQYTGGKLAKELEYDNGNLVKITEYKDNELFKIKEFKDNALFKIIYYKKGKPFKTEFYENNVLVKTVRSFENRFFVKYNNPFNQTEGIYYVEFDNNFENDSIKKIIGNLIKKRNVFIKDKNNLKPDFLIKLKSVNDTIVFEYLTAGEEISAKQPETVKSNDVEKILKKIKELFPVYCFSFSVRKQTDNEIFYLDLNKGYKQGIEKKMHLFVFDNEYKIKMSELKVIKSYENKSICKVLSYNEWLKKKMDKKADIFIVE